MCMCVCVCAVKNIKANCDELTWKKKHVYKFICLKHVTTRSYFYTYIKLWEVNFIHILSYENGRARIAKLFHTFDLYTMNHSSLSSINIPAKRFKEIIQRYNILQ